MVWLIAVTLVTAMAIAYAVGFRRSLALAVSVGPRRMHSLPSQHGALVMLWCGVAAAIGLALCAVLGLSARSLTLAAVAIGCGGSGALLASLRVRPELRARTE